jgi:hypothetical protein
MRHRWRDSLLLLAGNPSFVRHFSDPGRLQRFMLHLVLLAEGVGVPANLLTGSLREPTSLLRDVGLCPNFSEESSVLERISSAVCEDGGCLLRVADSYFVWLIGILVDYKTG